MMFADVGQERRFEQRRGTHMAITFQARRISKDRVHSLRKTGDITKGILLDSFKGFIIVEPVETKLGDGGVLTRETASFEIHPVWCQEPKEKIQEARKRLELNLYSDGE